MAFETTKHDVNRATTGIKLPSDVLGEVWQSTIAASFVMNHARRMSIPGTGTNVNIITGDPTPGWVTESTEKPVSTPTFNNKVMTPYKIAVIVPFSNEFRRDVPTLYNAIANRVPAVLAKTFDETVFFGTAPGTNFDTLASVDGVDLEAAPADAINGAMTDIMVDGGVANAIALAPQGYGILTGAKNTDGSLTFGGSYNTTGRITPFGLPVDVTSAAYKSGSSAANTVGFIGDWNKAIVGMVEDIRVDFSNQATINDGTKQINLWQRNMFALLCEMEVGFIVESTDYFKKFTDTYPAA